ncbi:MAG: M56 family metallopeptidase [Paracoccaceae bacterium]|jgi:hypothetical protein
MISLSSVIDAYIDINILLLLALVLWMTSRTLLRSFGMKYAYSTQLHLLNGVFLATLLLPLIVALGGKALLPAGAESINLSDFVLAQYLNGSFEMRPLAVESLLDIRHRFSIEIATLSTPFAATLVGLLCVGVAVSVLRLGMGILWLRNIVDSSFIWRQFGNLQLRLSDTVTVPFSTRTLKRRIVVIPSSFLENTAELNIVLGHEFQHLRQHDLEWEIALELLKPLFFWNPAFCIWKRKMETLRELSCDQNVVMRKKLNVVAYCYCLLKVCKNSLVHPKLFAVTVPRVALVETRTSLFGLDSANELHDRLISLLEFETKQCPKVVYLLIFVPLIAITLFATIAIQQPKDWSQDSLMLSSIVNLERLAEHNGSVPEIVPRQAN